MLYTDPLSKVVVWLPVQLVSYSVWGSLPWDFLLKSVTVGQIITEENTLPQKKTAELMRSGVEGGAYSRSGQRKASWPHRNTFCHGYSCFIHSLTFAKANNTMLHFQITFQQQHKLLR